MKITKLLSLDPSSTAIGYCVSTGHGQLVEFGKITGPSKLDAINRLDRDMIPDLANIIQNHMPNSEVDQLVAIVETPSPGQAGKKTKRWGAMRGLATYGIAVGMVLNELRHAGVIAQTTRADQWTNGTKKGVRQIWVEQKYEKYDRAKLKDSGGDVSDAISLGDWWWTRQGVMR